MSLNWKQWIKLGFSTRQARELSRLDAGSGGSSLAVWGAVTSDPTSVGFAEAAATTLLELYVSDGGTGWANADAATVALPDGVFMCALQLDVNTVPDAPFKFVVKDAADGFVMAGTVGPNDDLYSRLNGVGGPLISSDAFGTNGVKVSVTYADTEPTTGDIGWRLTLWKIGDLPA